MTDDVIANQLIVQCIHRFEALIHQSAKQQTTNRFTITDHGWRESVLSVIDSLSPLMPFETTADFYLLTTKLRAKHCPINKAIAPESALDYRCAAGASRQVTDSNIFALFSSKKR